MSTTAAISRESSASPRFGGRHVILAVLLLVLFLGLKAVFSLELGQRSLDGNYYYQIARHVAQGDGLKTSVSLYHQGLKELPHQTNQNPLWPLVLGYSGRMIGLETASALLPELLYLLCLVLLYVVATRVAVELAGDGSGSFAVSGGKYFGFGHLAILLFGLNPVFFFFTSLPYTEGLAFVLFLSAVLMAVRAMETQGLTWALLAGGVAMLAFLARAQFIGAPITILLALLFCSLGNRGYLKPLLAASIGAAACLAPWVAYLASWIKPFRPGAMFGLGAYRETPELLEYPMRVVTDSLLELWMNRLSGLLTAFTPRDENSYLVSFGAVAFVVPLAVVVVLARPALMSSVKQLLPLRRPTTWLLVVGGSSMVIPLHTLHFTFFKEWLFGHRHGLPLIFLVVVAVPFLLRSRIRSMRWLAGGLALSSVVSGGFAIAIMLTEVRLGLTEPERNLVRWLDRDADSPSVGITTRAQTLGAVSTTAFHWIRCDEPSSQTRTLLDRTSAEFVVAYPDETECPFLKDLLQDLEVVRTFESQATVLQVLRPRWQE